MIYKSKIAWWFYLVIITCLIPIIPISFSSDWGQGLSFATISALFVMILTNGFVFYLMRYTVYRIDGDVLTVKVGRLTKLQISINDIASIRETNNPISAPALSLDRLQVSYRNGNVLVSPKLKKEFIAHLLKVNPTIKILERK